MAGDKAAAREGAATEASAVKAAEICRQKQELRGRLLGLRAGMAAEERKRRGRLIFEAVTGLEVYRRAPVLFSYVSFKDEVDTLGLIAHALDCGKKVAVPRCMPGSREMEFYYISSLSGLSPGSYGIPEPQPSTACRATGSAGADLCIVPGLSFDAGGGRLGYGKGYYDRFLSRFHGSAVGLCYAPLYSGQPLPAGRFDARVSLVVTDTAVISV